MNLYNTSSRGSYGSRYSRYNSSSASKGKGTQDDHPIFQWKDGVIPGVQPTYLRRASDVDQMLRQATGPFGFDLEWKPTFIKGQAESPVAVVQLAKDSEIYIMQISAMNEFPQRLQEVLEDPDIVKAGVGIAGDAKKLWRDCGVSLLGAVELSHLARSADALRWMEGKPSQLISLTRLMEAYQDRRLSKGRARMSNWETYLERYQIEYAASDALAGYILYQQLIDLGPQASPNVYMSNFLAGKRESLPEQPIIHSGVVTFVPPSSPTGPDIPE